jgi:hypothetical protein
MNSLIISIQEARKILGKKAEGMTDAEIAFAIETLDLIAKDALKLSKEELHRKRDAYRMAQLTYDIYRDKNGKDAERFDQQ